MTGAFPDAVAQANTAVKVTTGPPNQNQVVVPGAAPGAIDPGAWGTPYNLQTGLVRFAPMQPIPPTKITKADVNPLWPTSSVPLATTFLSKPPMTTTQTQPQTFSVQSHANTVGFMYESSRHTNLFHRPHLNHILTIWRSSWIVGRIEGYQELLGKSMKYLTHVRRAYGLPSLSVLQANGQDESYKPSRFRQSHQDCLCLPLLFRLSITHQYRT